MNTQKNNFELISFDICPYVQRSVITLLHKKIEFKLTFIDLNQPPEWFEKVSPFGKVPLLLVKHGNEDKPHVLFESAIINEYIDEVSPPHLLHGDPLQKAKDRGWIEASSELLGLMYTAMTDEAEEKESLTDFWGLLQKIEAQWSGKKFFLGNAFSLVDAAFAPVFVRTEIFTALRESEEWRKLPQVSEWAKNLRALPEVKESMIPNFKQRYREVMNDYESRWAKEID